MVRDLNFNNTTDMLAALQHSKLVVWAYPPVAFTDKSLLTLTTLELSGSEEAGNSAFIIG